MCGARFPRYVGAALTPQDIQTAKQDHNYSLDQEEPPPVFIDVDDLLRTRLPLSGTFREPPETPGQSRARWGTTKIGETSDPETVSTTGCDLEEPSTQVGTEELKEEPEEPPQEAARLRDPLGDPLGDPLQT